MCIRDRAYCAQFIFLIGLVEGLNCDEYLAQFLGLFVYGGVNFLMNKKVTFKSVSYTHLDVYKRQI